MAPGTCECDLFFSFLFSFLQIKLFSTVIKIRGVVLDWVCSHPMTGVLITGKVRDAETGTQGEQQVKTEAEPGGCMCKSRNPRIMGNPHKLGRRRFFLRASRGSMAPPSP